MATYYKPNPAAPNDVVFQIAAPRVQLTDPAGVITELPTAPVTWANLSGRPAVVASGVSIPLARASISAAASGTNGDITSFSGLSLSVNGVALSATDKITLNVGGTLVTNTLAQLFQFLAAAGVTTNAKAQIVALTASSTAADIVAALKA